MILLKSVFRWQTRRNLAAHHLWRARSGGAEPDVALRREGRQPRAGAHPVALPVKGHVEAEVRVASAVQGVREAIPAAALVRSDSR